jgi:hypothetical protein
MTGVSQFSVTSMSVLTKAVLQKSQCWVPVHRAQERNSLSFFSAGKTSVWLIHSVGVVKRHTVAWTEGKIVPVR